MRISYFFPIVKEKKTSINKKVRNNALSAAMGGLFT
uniref:Uncharacterized protein n=1 Tax=Rhizophora mucronata TaxID=61149 RepID=A0A2P2NI69_RHIMU